MTSGNDNAKGNRRLPKWFRVALWALAGLLVVFHIGGGFVFSNMIRSDALEPRPPTPDNGVVVVGLGDGVIRITSVEERDDTVHPGVFGLSYPEGYGRLGAIRSVEGLDVTRDFTVTAGELPAICESELSGCPEVDIEGWAYQTDPSDIGINFTEVRYESPVGEFGAWRIDAGDGDVWAIHAHGWRAARREAVRSLPAYVDSGITSLVIDYRNDPDSPSDESGLYMFGATEWEEVEGAVKYALEQGATEVILVGYSTGAALHAAFMEHSTLANRVVAIVFDSPNLDMGRTIRTAAEDRTIPGTPIPVPPSLLWTAMTISELRFGIDWSEINYVPRAADFLGVPTLVFHGTEDDRVDIEVSRELASVTSKVELFETEGAGHVTSWNIDPDRYIRRLAGFLESVSS